MRVNGVEIEATTPTLEKKPTRPHINAAIMVRVDSLGPEEALPGKAFLTYGIRPLPADINHELLSDEDTRWQGLFNERVEDDTPVYFENAEILNIVGPDEVGTATAVFIRDGIDDKLDSGNWSHINEFELRVCVSLDTPEVTNLENNCATQDIIILRNLYDTRGRDANINATATAQATACGATGVDCDRKIEQLNFSDNTFSASVTGQIWKEQGSSYNPATLEIGEKGKEVQGEGAWYEAGVFSRASVRSQNFTIVDLYLSTIHNRNANDEIHLGFKLLNQDKIPDTTLSWGNNTLTLADVLAAAGSANNTSYGTTFTLRHTLAGINTSVPCGSVTAGLFADLELGVDPNATSIGKSTIPGSSSSPQCNGKPQSNGVCYELIDMGAGKNFFDFEMACQALGAAPAAVRDAADLAAINQARGSVQDEAWLGTFMRQGYTYRFYSNDPNVMGLSTLDKFTPAWFIRDPRALDLPFTVTPLLQFGSGGSTLTTAVTTVNNFGSYQLLQERNTYPYATTAKANSTEMIFRRAGRTALRYGVCAYPNTGTSLGGVSLTTTLEPFVDVSMSAVLGISFSFVSFSITATLSLINLAVPFTANLDVEFLNGGGARMTLSAQIRAVLTTLAGSIRFEIAWRFLWFNNKHTKTLASWNGIVLGNWQLLNLGPVVRTF